MFGGVVYDSRTGALVRVVGIAEVDECRCCVGDSEARSRAFCVG